jgi:hypothetical protein
VIEIDDQELPMATDTVDALPAQASHEFFVRLAPYRPVARDGNIDDPPAPQRRIQTAANRFNLG